MTDDSNTGNLYQPAQAELRHHVDADQNDNLYWTDASRGKRFLAHIIDLALILLLTSGVSGVLAVMFYEQMQPILDDEILLGLVGGGIAITLYSLVNGVPLHLRGQTIGKMLMKIRIIRIDQRPGSVWRFLGLRYVVNQMIMIIPIAGNFYALIDALFIFREDHRCIHDLLASTRVVNVTPMEEDPYAPDSRFDALPDGT